MMNNPDKNSTKHSPSLSAFYFFVNIISICCHSQIFYFASFSADLIHQPCFCYDSDLHSGHKTGKYTPYHDSIKPLLFFTALFSFSNI
jgi:hypothetical protein